ncbi:MAG: hypothetical protein ACI9MR_001704 [Myxococcota bacterium]|jgi:hypothetical protein
MSILVSLLVPGALVACDSEGTGGSGGFLGDLQGTYALTETCDVQGLGSAITASCQGVFIDGRALDTATMSLRLAETRLTGAAAYMRENDSDPEGAYEIIFDCAGAVACRYDVDVDIVREQGRTVVGDFKNIAGDWLGELTIERSCTVTGIDGNNASCASARDDAIKKHFTVIRVDASISGSEATLDYSHTSQSADGQLGSPGSGSYKVLSGPAGMTVIRDYDSEYCRDYPEDCTLGFAAKK